MQIADDMLGFTQFNSHFSKAVQMASINIDTGRNGEITRVHFVTIDALTVLHELKRSTHSHYSSKGDRVISIRLGMPTNSVKFVGKNMLDIRMTGETKYTSLSADDEFHPNGSWRVDLFTNDELSVRISYGNTYQPCDVCGQVHKNKAAYHSCMAQAFEDLAANEQNRRSLDEGVWLFDK
jgi:hypothetical protein